MLYLAEICLLTNARRTASVIAKTTCDVFILSAEDFREVLEEHPNMRSVMEMEAEKRLTSMGTSVDLATDQQEGHHVKFQAGAPDVSSSGCSCRANVHESSEHVIARELPETGSHEDTVV